MLEAIYEKDVVRVLDTIEADPLRVVLWNAVCDAIDFVCDTPESAAAKREALRLPSGKTIWQVPIRCFTEDEDWVLLWYADTNGTDAVIVYIGSRAFR